MASSSPAADPAADRGADLAADVVVVGAGGAGLPAAISAADAGASVIVVEASARRKGARFLLRHRMTRILRQNSAGRNGRVHGIMVGCDGSQIAIAASRGVVISTGGHSSSVSFRRAIDARLTEEYQTAGEPWTRQNADGEFAALEIGAGLWGLGIAGTESERRLGTNGNLGTDGKANGGGPIWAIFDSAAVRREGWDPVPPNVDPDGWFFSAASPGALARQINNPYQRKPMAPSVLEESVTAYNRAVGRLRRSVRQADSRGSCRGAAAADSGSAILCRLGNADSARLRHGPAHWQKVPGAGPARRGYRRLVLCRGVGRGIWIARPSPSAGIRPNRGPRGER